MPPYVPDPTLDLVFERVVPVPPALVWRAWTEPELMLRWFTPAPWKTTAADLDLRPGGRFSVVMESPEGQAYPMTGCILHLVPNRELVWTHALGPDFRPAPGGDDGPCITARITLEPHGAGTRYRAVAQHKDLADRQAHEAMGFEIGWGQALDQLVALMQQG